jgi:mono/diheme cytochrome c family protein
VFNDALGRDGGCQGCHPAHRSDGAMDKYPISYAGNNVNADGDNRLNQGGCFVGRDVHSNPLKEVDGAGTPEHLNAVGQWLQTNVSTGQAGLAGNPADYRGIWCTNCHTQLSQEIWRHEDCNNLITGDCVNDVRGLPTLNDVAIAVGLTEEQAINYLDPKVAGFDRSTDQTHAVWNPSIPDANVATIEVSTTGPGACAPLTGVFNATFGVDVCVSLDGDGDPSVNILSFCTTQDCVDLINNNPTDQTQWRYPANAFAGTGTVAAAVPFSAADDARDHWLSPGEPHCADCHAAPYTEQSGNISAYPPFNYPAKASLMRYTRGHQDISCQGCHESIHGLYPVSAAVDNTSYAQAAALNSDGSHGPLKCGACHNVASQANQIPTWILGGGLVGSEIGSDFDNAVTWAHTYTDEASVLNSTCQNCHGVNGQFGGGFDANSTPAQWTNLSAAASCAPAGTCEAYMGHSMRGNTSREMMDKAETAVTGDVIGATNPAGTACAGCHVSFNPSSCTQPWKQHLTQGRVAESVWVEVSNAALGNTCGW